MKWHRSGHPICSDVRIPFALLLGSYVALGLTVLGFNRSPWQAALTVAAAVGFDLTFNRAFRGRGWAFPWSGLITGLGLCLLLNYGSDPWLPILPAFLAIASKHVFTVRGRHVFNPTLFGLVVGAWFSAGMISPAPAYQWGGSLALALFLTAVAFSLFVFRVGRAPLALSFLAFYGVQLAFRASVMRHHLPPETLVLGTITSAPFFLFVFYMLTDPMTSPRSARGQVFLALAVTLVDLYFHTRRSYSTLFPALFSVQCAVLVTGWLRAARDARWRLSPKPEGTRKLAITGALGAVVIVANAMGGRPHIADAGFRWTAVSAAGSGIADARLDGVLEEVDPRVRHIAKWVLSVGDAAAVADVDGDGWQDLFLTNPLKGPADRCSLYRNTGGLSFERVPLPALEPLCSHPETHGLPSAAVFADYDNDGDQDLFLGVGFGPSRLLRNDGGLQFSDVTDQVGLAGYTSCLAALFIDFDQDGDLDLLVGNAMAPYLPDYDPPRALNIYDLPEPEFVGDRRMFHFMHSSWHKAENGGRNQLYRNLGDGHFEAEDMEAIGLPETHWTLALNAADFDQDGWPDIYAASDFGPDDLYINRGGERFERRQGGVFGSIGKDTYKGMNCSLADFDGNGWIDIYVSNVHAPLQAEGSLLWMVSPDRGGGVRFRNRAAQLGALNEHRFGWGATAGDLDRDGWPDLVQANGMVDDSMDRRFDRPRDYWYTNGRLARTGPEVHAYADRWGDIRGYSIFGAQRNRVLMNLRGRRFAEAAEVTGLAEEGNTRAAALADFDNDGDLDLVLTHQFEPAELFRNDPTRAARWIGLQLVGDGRRVNRDATNARVELRSGDWRRVAEVTNVSGFSAQGDRRLFFGLPGDTGHVDVHVSWRAGLETRFRSLAADRYHILVLPPPARLP